MRWRSPAVNCSPDQLLHPSIAFIFERLQTYQKGVGFADQVAALTEGLLRAYGDLAGQFERATHSIAANIATASPRGR